MARPGFLIGAIYVYILALIQVGLDSLSGKRSFKNNFFDRVYIRGGFILNFFSSGVIVSMNLYLQKMVRRRGSSVKSVIIDLRFKKKVTRKQVKIGGQGAAKCGELEE